MTNITNELGLWYVTSSFQRNNFRFDGQTEVQLTARTVTVGLLNGPLDSFYYSFGCINVLDSNTVCDYKSRGSPTVLFLKRPCKCVLMVF